MQDEGTKFVFSATEQNALQLYMEKETKNHFLLMRKRVKYAITVLMPEKCSLCYYEDCQRLDAAESLS